MTVQPDEIVQAKLEVLIMPNGELICLGKRVGWFKDFSKFLSEPKDITGQLIKGEA